MNNEKLVGFNGISSLVSTIETDKYSSSKDVTDEPVTRKETVSEIADDEQPSRPPKSINDNSSSHFKLSWKFALTAIFLVFVVIINLQENSDNKYNAASKITSKPESIKHQANTSSSNKAKMTFTMPQTGTSRVLGLSELRWCLREGITLETFNVELNVNNSDGNVIDKFNSLVDRYNARCGNYQYYPDKLDRAKREISALKSEIERKAIKDFNLLAKGNIVKDLNKYNVLDVQNALNRLGYNAGVADGIMGKRTRAAIEAYQKDHNLFIDGAITPELLSRLQIR